MSKTVLVTGGAGFIGSNLVERLLKEGWNVLVFDNFSTGKHENLKGLESVKIIEGDISKDFYSALVRVSKNHGAIDAVVHLAAQVSVQKSIESPVLDAKQNYLPIHDLLKFVNTHPSLESLVFASSAAVYGDVEVFPVNEKTDCNPLSPYGLHKLMCEKALFANPKKINATALRFFNVYGPKQDPKSPYSGVISVFIDKVKSRTGPVIFGSGKQTRDFIYIDNVVDVICSALKNKIEGFRRLNVGNSKETSVLDLAYKICEAQGLNPEEISFLPSREGDILKSLACTKLLHQELGEFEEVEIDSGLQKTTNWILGQH